MDQVWPNLIVEDGNLRYQVASLRRALEDGCESNHYVITVQGRGHVFASRVSRSLGDKQQSEVMHPGGSHQLPGVGKTTVVAAVADAPLSPLEGTIRLVELGALTDAALDPATLASIFGLTDQSAVPNENLAGLLCNKHILVIVDSGEHAIAVAARVVKT